MFQRRYESLHAGGLASFGGLPRVLTVLLLVLALGVLLVNLLVLRRSLAGTEESTSPAAEAAPNVPQEDEGKILEEEKEQVDERPDQRPMEWARQEEEINEEEQDRQLAMREKAGPEPLNPNQPLSKLQKQRLKLQRIYEEIHVRLTAQQHLVPHREKPLIYYTSPVSDFLGRHFLETPPECPRQCDYTEDERRLDQALVVVYHLPTTDGSEVSLPKTRQQARVLLSMEADRRLQDWKKLVDWEWSYRLAAEIWATYVPPEKHFRKPIRPKTADNLITAFISNCGGTNNRRDLFHKLSKFIKVDSFGRCWTNAKQLPGELKIDTLARYKFHLAWENTNMPDYVTEKVYHAFEAGTIPIYYGAPNIDLFVPEHSIIKVSDFPTLEGLVEYIKKVAADDELYNSYMEWRNKDVDDWGEFRTLMKRNKHDSRCQMCLQAHQFQELLWEEDDK